MDLPEDLDTLARLAVTLPRWEWRPGMRARHEPDGPFVRVCIAAGLLDVVHDSGRHVGVHQPAVLSDSLSPDFTDPATKGAVLGLLREACGEPTLHPSCRMPIAPDMSGRVPPSWCMRDGVGRRLHGWAPMQPTEIHALIAALAALPPETT